MKRLLIKTVSLLLLLAFSANTCCYGLAPPLASQNPLIKRKILAALYRTQIKYAEFEDEERLLEANNAECLLLSSGKYLVTKEVAQNDLRLLRAIIHEDIEAIMQIFAKEDRDKYQGIKELILKYFPPDENNKLAIELYVNHTVARAFEWLILIEEKNIVKEDISHNEAIFIKSISPIINVNRHNYFTPEFWDFSTRREKIKSAVNNGMRFYQVADYHGRHPQPSIKIEGKDAKVKIPIDVICAALESNKNIFPDKVAGKVIKDLKKIGTRLISIAELKKEFVENADWAHRKIAFTGGPYAGKTTYLKDLTQRYADDVIYLPEIIGPLAKAAIVLDDDINGQRLVYMLKYLLERETSILYPDRIILCDRGTVDGVAYWPDGRMEFEREIGDIRKECNRYEASIMLETVAVKSQKEFSDRKEDAKKAAKIDSALKDVWRLNRRFYFVEHEDWGKKTEKTNFIVSKLIDSIKNGHKVPPAIDVEVAGKRYRLPTISAYQFSDAELRSFFTNKVIGSAVPLVLDLNMVAPCQASCIYCFTESGSMSRNRGQEADRFHVDKKYDPITPAELEEMISQYADLGGKVVFICSDGEPLTKLDEFFRYACVARSKGLRVVVYTNMIAVTKNVAQRLYDEDIDVVCKIEDLDPKINDKIIRPRGKGYIYVDYKGVRIPEQLTILLEQYKDKPDKIALCSMITRINIDHLLQMRKWAYETLGIAHFVKQIYWYGFADTFRKELEPTSEHRKRFEEELYRYDAEYGFVYPADLSDEFSYDVRRFLNNVLTRDGFPFRVFSHIRGGFYHSSGAVKPRFSFLDGVQVSTRDNGQINLKQFFRKIYLYTSLYKIIDSIHPMNSEERRRRLAGLIPDWMIESYIAGGYPEAKEIVGDYIASNFKFSAFKASKQKGAWSVTDPWLNTRGELREIYTELVGYLLDYTNGIRDKLSAEEIITIIHQIRRLLTQEEAVPFIHSLRMLKPSMSFMDMRDVHTACRMLALSDFSETLSLSQFENFLRKDIKINDSNKLEKDLDNSVSVIYVCGLSSGLTADLLFIQEQLKRWNDKGLVTIVAKKDSLFSEATIREVELQIEDPCFAYLKDQRLNGRLSIVENHSKCRGTNLFEIDSRLKELIMSVDGKRTILIARGEGNTLTLDPIGVPHYRIGLAESPLAQQYVGIPWDKNESDVPEPFILYVPSGIKVAEEFSGCILPPRQTMVDFFWARKNIEEKTNGSPDYETIRAGMKMGRKTFVEEVAPEILLVNPLDISHFTEIHSMNGEQIRYFVDRENKNSLLLSARNRADVAVAFSELYETTDGQKPEPTGTNSLFVGAHTAKEASLNQRNKVLASGIAVNLSEGGPLMLEVGVASQNSPGKHSSAHQRNLMTPQSIADAYDGAEFIFSLMYFFIPQLKIEYNMFRKDRPEEQLIDELENMFIDTHKFCGEEEHIPLYNKAYIACGNNGEIISGIRRLRGGHMYLGDRSDIAWTVNDLVDSPEKLLALESSLERPPVLVYTPMCSENIDIARRNLNYRYGEYGKDPYYFPVGKDRYNIIIVDNRVITIKYGDVLMPPVGIVISLSKDMFERCVSENVEKDEVFSVAGKMVFRLKYGSTFRFDLEPPEEISVDYWRKLKWIVGGGNFVVYKGKDVISDAKKRAEMFEEEGWYRKLSTQTLDRQVYVDERNSKIIAGRTKDGKFFVVTLDGRRERGGARFDEAMSIIYNKLGEDNIEWAVNMDGGSSVSLCEVVDGKAHLVNCPIKGGDSWVGSARGINSFSIITRLKPALADITGSEIVKVSEIWKSYAELGQIRRILRLPSRMQSMRTIYLISTNKGDYVLRADKKGDMETIRRMDEQASFLKKREFPYHIPSVLSADNGEKYIVNDDGSYFVTDYFKDVDPDDNSFYTYYSDLADEQIKLSALLLAKFHKAMASYEPGGPVLEPRTIDLLARRVEMLQKLAKNANSQPDTNSERFFKENIGYILARSERFYTEHKDAIDKLPHTFIHGDFQPINILLKDKKPIGLIDFERVRKDSVLIDFISSILENKSYNPVVSIKKLKVFLKAYLKERLLSQDELAMLSVFFELNCLTRLTSILANDNMLKKIDEDSDFYYLAQKILERLNTIEDQMPTIKNAIDEVVAELEAEKPRTADELNELNSSAFKSGEGFYHSEDASSFSQKLEAILDHDKHERGVPFNLKDGRDYWTGVADDELTGAGVTLHKVFNMGCDQNFRGVPSKGARSECLLCVSCRLPEDKGLIIDDDWEAKANLYPIFKGTHGILIYRKHTKQELKRFTVRTMLTWAKEAHGYRFFYNGKNVGATSPDHLHIQFFKSFEPFNKIHDDSPIEKHCKDSSNLSMLIIGKNGITVRMIEKYPTKERAIIAFLVEGKLGNISNIADQADLLLRILDKEGLDYDVLSKCDGKYLYMIIVPRSNKQIGAKDDKSRFTVKTSKEYLLGRSKNSATPMKRETDRVFAMIEFTGIFVAVDEEQYMHVTYEDLVTILNQLGVGSCDTVSAKLIGEIKGASNVNRTQANIREFGKTSKKFFVLGAGTIWFGRTWPPSGNSYAYPSSEEVNAYLDKVFEKMSNAEEVVMLDTAPAYGTSEERIGEYLRTRGLLLKVFIATKWGAEFDSVTDTSTLHHTKEHLIFSVNRSILRLSKIDLLYIHGTTVEVLKNQDIINEMERMKEEHYGGIQYIGASISDEKVLEQAVKEDLLKDLDVVQMPGSLFLKRSDLIEHISGKGIAIVVNSPISKSEKDKNPEAIYADLLKQPGLSIILTGTRYHLNETLEYISKHTVADSEKQPKIEATRMDKIIEDDTEFAIILWSDLIDSALHSRTYL